MLDWQAVRGNPCITCRGIAVMIGLSTLTAFSEHGVVESDFFGLRHYAGVYIPPAVDTLLTFVMMCVIWVVCERFIVGRLIRRKAARDGGTR